MDAYRSALAVLPHVFQLHDLRIPSVVDVGCGDGAWAAAAAVLGANRVLGMDLHDGTAADLKIPYHHYWQNDLTNPMVPDERFDLAICVEVGEHLPTSASEGLVKYLTTLAPLVLFSAAPPGQGPVGPGPSLHENEQESSFWENLFQSQGFAYQDAIRPRIWQDPRVDPWYVANLAIYAKGQPRWASSETLVDRSLLAALYAKAAKADQ